MVVKEVSWEIQNYFTKMDFQVMNMTRADVVLGKEWLYSLGMTLSRSYTHNTISFTDSIDAHVLMIRERDVPQSPLVCTVKLQSMVFGNEIEELFFCYFLPTMSHVSQCCLNSNSILENDCENESNEAQHFLSTMSLQTTSNIIDQSDYQTKLSQIQTEFSDVFLADLPKGLPPDHGITHDIDLIPGAKPISKPFYHLSANKA